MIKMVKNFEIFLLNHCPKLVGSPDLSELPFVENVVFLIKFRFQFESIAIAKVGTKRIGCIGQTGTVQNHGFLIRFQFLADLIPTKNGRDCDGDRETGKSQVQPRIPQLKSKPHRQKRSNSN